MTFSLEVARFLHRGKNLQPQNLFCNFLWPILHTSPIFCPLIVHEMVLVSRFSPGRQKFTNKSSIIKNTKQTKITFSNINFDYIQRKQNHIITQKLKVCLNSSFLTSLNIILKPPSLLEID